MTRAAEQPNAAAASADFEFQALGEARNYRTALVREFQPYLAGRVIEIGSGVGQVTDELRRLPAVADLLCIEPHPPFCRVFRETHPGQRLLEGTIRDAPAEPGWDAVLSINVLEHIEADGEELEVYRRLLEARGGHLCLFVPARPQLYAPIDRDFGHHRHTKPRLRLVLERAGFDVVLLRYYNLVGYFAWWMTFRLLGRRHFDRAAVRVFDRGIFPLVHAVESRVAPPFGQSLLAVARVVRSGR